MLFIIVTVFKGVKIKQLGFHTLFSCPFLESTICLLFHSRFYAIFINSRTLAFSLYYFTLYCAARTISFFSLLTTQHF